MSIIPVITTPLTLITAQFLLFADNTPIQTLVAFLLAVVLIGITVFSLTYKK